MSTYTDYRDRLKGIAFPYAVLDLNLLQQNIATNKKRAQDKLIRIASKSIRSVEVMRMILDSGPEVQGIMTYHGKEMLELARLGFDDLLMGYPIVDTKLLDALAGLVKIGFTICLMVDSKEHLEMVEAAGQQAGVQIPVCLDLDLSDDYPGLRFGVWRSSISTTSDLVNRLDVIDELKHVKLEGLMGYEAQVAGVGDLLPGERVKNALIQGLQRRSRRKIALRRSAAVALTRERGHQLRFVNGGGTGSLETTVQEEDVTEVTVGSGFYNPHLFDYYRNFNLTPALFYGVQIVRRPTHDVYTCHGGGFIASGGVHHSKAPIVHLPASGKLDVHEGAGEVQTPVRFSKLQETLSLGDPVYLRHAKAGELCERFEELHCIDGDVINRIETYRGAGFSFG